MRLHPCASSINWPWWWSTRTKELLNGSWEAMITKTWIIICFKLGVVLFHLAALSQGTLSSLAYLLKKLLSLSFQQKPFIILAFWGASQAKTRETSLIPSWIKSFGFICEVWLHLESRREQYVKNVRKPVYFKRMKSISVVLIWFQIRLNFSNHIILGLIGVPM